MKQIAKKIGWRIYHFVHTNGLVADTVYSLAFYLQNFIRIRQYKRFSRQPVTPEELFAHRQLSREAYLVTGVTNICNAKCTFCAYPKVIANKTLETGVMPLATFKKAVDEWSALGGQSLDLTPVVGDPLVDPGLLEKLDYAVNQAGLKDVYLTTNAILINKNDTYKKLIDLGVAAVFISTQGASKEAYEKIYGVNHYEAAMSGIRNLMAYNRSRGEPARIVVRFRNHEKPSEIIRSPDFKKNIQPFLSARVRVNYTVDFDNWGGTIKPEDLSGNMRMRTLPPMLNIPCKNLFNFAVRHDGRVRLCGCRLTQNDNDDLVAGNLHESSLMDISKSPAAWEKIKGFYTGNRPATCVECTFYQPVTRAWLKERTSPTDSPA
ncbi:MAG: radical SAM protein [Verrucomicrobiota bacterium]